MKSKKKNKNKRCTIQLITTCWLMPDSFPNSDRLPFQVTPPFYTLAIMAYGISLWPVWLTCPNYAPPSHIFGFVVFVPPHWQSTRHKKLLDLG